jgi:hypothetical protein
MKNANEPRVSAAAGNPQIAVEVPVTAVWRCPGGLYVGQDVLQHRIDHRHSTAAGAEGAIRALKRRLSNLVYAPTVADQTRRQTDPGGHSGTTLHSSVTDLTPDIGSSDKPLPGPATNHPKPPVPAGALT